jgi:somatic embryogenesis receptor kinase 1
MALYFFSLQLGEFLPDRKTLTIQTMQVALLCTQMSPTDRPRMADVVRMLEGDGLAERWEEWQKVEIVRRGQEMDLMPRALSDWVEDSTFNMDAVELSAGR